MNGTLCEKDVFKDAMETAIAEAAKTGKRYFVLFPYIANVIDGKPNGGEIFLGVPVIHEMAVEGDERQDIAFTVYPNGTVAYGETAQNDQIRNCEQKHDLRI